MDINMGMIDLAEIYEVMQWHEVSDHTDGKHVGLFIKLPRNLAEKFPSSEQDKSPKHCTLLYLGRFNEMMEEKLISVVQEVCKQIKPFTVKFGPKAKVFADEGDGKVVYSPVKSGKLKKLNEMLKQALSLGQIPYNMDHPEYHPHITIGYAQSRQEKREMKDLAPEGEFLVKEIWLWGTNSPRLITLGNK